MTTSEVELPFGRLTLKETRTGILTSRVSSVTPYQLGTLGVPTMTPLASTDKP